MEIKVHILHCGRVRVDRSLPFSEKSWNPISYTGLFRPMKYQVWLPVSAYLIEHPKGLVLIDTGWHTDVRRGDQGRKHMGLLHWLINKAELPAGQAIHEQLATIGYRPEDIDYLVLSHLHSDHASGLKHVRNAKKIIVSDIEWREAIVKPIRYVPDMWKGVNVQQYSFSNTRIGPEGLSFDLFSDGTIIFVNTPGHTMGLAATIIRNNGKFLLLASDAGYAKKSWKEMIMPGVQVDKVKVKSSLEYVKLLSENAECVEAIANHDPDIKPQIILI